MKKNACSVMIAIMATVTGCSLHTTTDTGGTSADGGAKTTTGSNAPSAPSAPSPAANGLLLVGGSPAKLLVNTKEPEVAVPGETEKYWGHVFTVELDSSQETDIALCADTNGDVNAYLFVQPENDPKAIVEAPQARGANDTHGGVLANFRPAKSGRYTVYAVSTASQIRDTGGDYVLSASLAVAGKPFHCPE